MSAHLLPVLLLTVRQLHPVLGLSDHQAIDTIVRAALRWATYSGARQLGFPVVVAVLAVGFLVRRLLAAPRPRRKTRR